MPAPYQTPVNVGGQWANPSDPRDWSSWAKHGPYVLDPGTNLWGLPPQGVSGETPKTLEQQNQEFQSPFWQPSGAHTPGDPFNYRHIIEGRNDLLKRLFGQLPTAEGSAYGQSPGRGRLEGTLQALMGMSGRSSNMSFGPSSQASFGQDVQQTAPAARRGLLLQEPERLKGLMDLLRGTYTQGGDIVAQQMEDAARLTLLINQHKQARAALYSQVPVIGPGLSALATRG